MDSFQPPAFDQSLHHPSGSSSYNHHHHHGTATADPSINPFPTTATNTSTPFGQASAGDVKVNPYKSKGMSGDDIQKRQSFGGGDYGGQSPQQYPQPPTSFPAPPPTSSAPAVAPPVYIKDVSMLDTSSYNSDAHLLAACRNKGISPYFATQITRLREYSSVRLVLDDSGSMKAMQQVYGQPPTTRWNILQGMVKEIFDLMTIARGREPLDVYFLNMLPGGMKADTVDLLQPFFARVPSGTTPTLEVMREIMTPKYMVSRRLVLFFHPLVTNPSLRVRPPPVLAPSRSVKKASSPSSSPTAPPTAGTKPSEPFSSTSNVVTPLHTSPSGYALTTPLRWTNTNHPWTTGYLI
jgi:hypothetical protein